MSEEIDRVLADVMLAITEIKKLLSDSTEIKYDFAAKLTKEQVEAVLRTLEPGT